jgi:hypothetical protein
MSDSEPDDLQLFHDALKATLAANGVLGRVRAQLKVAALEAVRRQRDTDNVVARDINAHSMDLGDDAVVLAHALVLDFLATQSTLHSSASLFESEAGTERLPSALRTRRGLEHAARVDGSDAAEPLLVSLLRRPGGIAGLGTGASSVEPTPTRHRGHEDDDRDSHRTESSALASTEPSPSKAGLGAGAPAAESIGPSFNVAKAARWPQPNTRREASLECSDASADENAVADVAAGGGDWDYVDGGSATASAKAPSATAAAPRSTHVDAFASAGGPATTQAPSTSAGVLPASEPPRQSAMHPPEEQPSTDDEYDFDGDEEDTF